MNSPDIQIPLEPPAPPKTAATKSNPPSKLKAKLGRFFKPLGWFFLLFGSLVFFTFLKVPDSKIKNFIQGSLQGFLGNYGMSYVAGKSHFSIGFGIEYKIQDVQLFWPAPSDRVTPIQEIEISPSILPLLFGKLGGHFSMKEGDGWIKGSFSTQAFNKNKTISISLRSKKLDLGRLGFFQALTSMKGGALAGADIDFSGPTDIPTEWNGTLKLDFAKIKIEPQSLQGFTIPQVTLSEGALELKIDKGRAQIQKLKLGKEGSTEDDLIGSATGDIELKQPLDQSLLNLKTKFSLSENILKAFVLLDALLGGGKQADGSYAFALNGPIAAPAPEPIKEQH